MLPFTDATVPEIDIGGADRRGVPGAIESKTRFPLIPAQAGIQRVNV